MSRDEIRYMKALEVVLLKALETVQPLPPPALSGTLYEDAKRELRQINKKLNQLSTAALKAAKLRALLPD
jgi:hypothetical protein